MKYASETERTIATRLIDAALSRGYTVSVYDAVDGGGEYTVKRSTDRAVILDALCSTDGDTLLIRKAPTGSDKLGEKLGYIMLVWGNDEDLISDYSDNLEIGELVSATACQWFAACAEPATVDLPHPVLGTVPTCRSCAEKVRDLGG